MKENMLDVLMYMFEHCMDDDVEEHEPDHEELHNRLANVGFAPRAIDQAFDWLEQLAAQPASKGYHAQPQSGSVRIYSAGENQRLNQECRGYLNFLEQIGILAPDSRERIIEQAMALGPDEIDLDKLKWVILMVLFNQKGTTRRRLDWLEEFILGADKHTVVH